MALQQPLSSCILLNANARAVAGAAC